MIDAKIDTLKQEGLFPAANIVNDLAEYNHFKCASGSFSFSCTCSCYDACSSGKAAKGKVVVQGENVAEQQLQYWFQQADKENPNSFLKLGEKQK